MFTGTFTALVTPFRDGELDEAAFEKLVRSQIKGGVDGIVPMGTTGESPTLDYDEHLKVIELAVKFSGGKLPVLAGTGGNSTQEAIFLTQEAQKLGVDGSLQVAPYYNKPTQEGVYQHFAAIARSTRLPILLYSIPGRCGIEIGLDTVKRLATDFKNIVGIKDAGGSCDRVSQLRAACGPKFQIVSGDDSLTLPFMSVGAPRRHQRGLQCGPARGVQDGARVCGRGCQGGAEVAHPLVPALQEPLRRDQSVTVQDRVGVEGHDGRGSAPAAGALVDRHSRIDPQDLDRGGPALSHGLGCRPKLPGVV